MVKLVSMVQRTSVPKTKMNAVQEQITEPQESRMEYEYVNISLRDLK